MRENDESLWWLVADGCWEVSVTERTWSIVVSDALKVITCFTFSEPPIRLP